MSIDKIDQITDEAEPLEYKDLNDYQKNIAMSMGFMGIIACKDTPKKALKNSMEMLVRDGVTEAVAVTALYSFTNTLLVQIASQFEEPKDGKNKESKES